jgi:hypothetical protein
MRLLAHFFFWRPKFRIHDAINKIHRLRIIPVVVSVVVNAAATTAMPPYSNASVNDAAVNVVGLTSPAAAPSISTIPTLAAGPSLIPCSLAIERDACVIVGFLLRGIGHPNTTGRINVHV